MINFFKKILFKNFNIFILGCQRSGTTMLRLALNSHPEIYCYGEVGGYSYFEKNIKKKHSKFYNAFQLPIWTELFVEYESINKYKKENDKILFIFRDPKQTISSMKSLKCYRKDCWFGINDIGMEKNYINYEVVPNVNIWLNDDSRSFNKLFSNEIAKYKNTKWESLIKAICFWKYKNLSYFNMKELGWKIFPVNYEDLVKQPEKKLIEIMNFLNIKYNEEVLQHHLKNHDETWNNTAMGNTRTNRKIDEQSLQKWKNNINLEEEQFIKSHCELLFDKLKQEL